MTRFTSEARTATPGVIVGSALRLRLRDSAKVNPTMACLPVRKLAVEFVHRRVETLRFWLTGLNLNRALWMNSHHGDRQPGRDHGLDRSFDVQLSEWGGCASHLLPLPEPHTLPVQPCLRVALLKFLLAVIEVALGTREPRRPVAGTGAVQAVGDAPS